MTRFSFLFICLFFLPLFGKAHNQSAHEICLKATDYSGCIKNNQNASFADKAAATGAYGALECMRRQGHITQKEVKEAMRDVLREMNISQKLLFDSQVLRASRRASYLFREDCRTMNQANQLEMQEILGEEFQ